MKDTVKIYDDIVKEYFRPIQDIELAIAEKDLVKAKSSYGKFAAMISKTTPDEIINKRPSILRAIRYSLFVVFPLVGTGLLTFGVSLMTTNIDELVRKVRRYEDEYNYADIQTAIGDYKAELVHIERALKDTPEKSERYKALSAYRDQLKKAIKELEDWSTRAVREKAKDAKYSKYKSDIGNLTVKQRYELLQHLGESVVLDIPIITADSKNIVTNGKYSSLKESVAVPSDIFYVENVSKLFGTLDSIDLKRQCTTKMVNELDFAYDITDLAKNYMKFMPKLAEPRTGGLNAIIQSTRNFIITNALVAPIGMAQSFTGVKIYEHYINGVNVDTIVLTDRVPGECVILSVVYAGSNMSMIFRICDGVPLPYFAIFAGKTIFDAVRLNTNADTIAESACISILENLIGKTYPTYELLDEASIRDVARNVKNKVVQADKAVSNKIDSTVDYIKASAKKALLPDSREDIIKDTMPPLSKLLKQAVAVGAAWAINPALAAITAVTAVALNRKVKREARRKVLAELREELELVEEKIKDAESKGDNKNKYQLMRLRNKLKTSIEKIKYGDNFVDGRDSVE